MKDLYEILEGRDKFVLGRRFYTSARPDFQPLVWYAGNTIKVWVNYGTVLVEAS